jgi:hypothetical protein
MFNSEEELLIMLDAMANIIDKVEDLPEDCPAVKKSEVYKKIEDEIKELTAYMKNRTVEMNRQIDERDLQSNLRAMSGKKSYDN